MKSFQKFGIHLISQHSFWLSDHRSHTHTIAERWHDIELKTFKSFYHSYWKWVSRFPSKIQCPCLIVMNFSESSYQILHLELDVRMLCFWRKGKNGTHIAVSVLKNSKLHYAHTHTYSTEEWHIDTHTLSMNNSSHLCMQK